ncbi:hypothetical protein [Novosphingobium sp. Gsoil 351]|uniref:hypothetical protein n=1 Tax=Novosphingobium sp. Gsoil 351 TaxID=2675225 RepID=UPI0012B4857A|nr:hypothetical protein [Novosphingobium sp. Gsoil 351]QGN55708.1 hypothetical protein GKE62_15285 [Novosphingobium sp. Gsoil 351]
MTGRSPHLALPLILILAACGGGGGASIAIDGAFFGPQAAEVGGVYQFFRDGTEYTAGVFAAAKGP